MGKNIEIQNLQISDYSSYVKFEEILSRFHYETMPEIWAQVTSPESTYGSLLVRLNDPERRLFIATIDNSACGYVDCKIVRIDEGGRRMPRLGVCIHHLAVEYGYRRMGVAQRLIQAVEDWAREIGASCLELTVFEGNNDALKMYERVGFQTEKRTMTRSVESNKDESGLQMKKERQDNLPCKIIE